MEKLFELDPYLTHFTACVQSCVQSRKGWDVILDQTAFPSPQELEVLTYRSKTALPGRVRIVSFPGADSPMTWAPWAGPPFWRSTSGRAM